MSEMTTEPQPLALQVVAAFEKNETSISDVSKYMELTVAKNGIGNVTAGRVAVKKLRVSIDHRRKELIETALETQRTVNAHAKFLTAIVTPVEEYLEAQEDAYEAAKAKAEQERQAARLAILTGRIERLAQAGVVATDLAALEKMSDDEYLLHLTMETLRVETESRQREETRIAAQRIDAERRAEAERQAEELRVRSEELAADRLLLAEQQAEFARKQSGLRKSELEREEALRKEEQAAADTARSAALKPELDKVDGFCKDLDEWADEYLTRIDVSWREQALIVIEKACIEIRKQVEGRLAK